MTLASLASQAAATPAHAQAELQPPSGIEAQTLPPIDDVDAGELPAVAGSASPTTGFTGNAWQGLAIEEAGKLMVSIAVPVRSPALASLWRRQLASEGEPIGAAPGQFAQLRADALTRSGLLEEAASALTAANVGARAKRPHGLALASARLALALGRTPEACAILKEIPLEQTTLAKPLKTEAILLTAYCVSQDKQARTASLAAEVMRDQGVRSPLPLAVLDALATSKTPRLPKVDTLKLIDYKYLALLGPVDADRVTRTSGAEVLVAIMRDDGAAPETRLVAAETATQLNVVTPKSMIAFYADAAISDEQRANPLAVKGSGAVTRAALFQAATAETDSRRRLKFLAAFIEEARRDGLLLALAPVVAELVSTVPPDNDVLWFAEPAIETLIGAGYYDRALPWAIASGGSLLHWTLLIAIADPTAAVPLDSALSYTEQIVQDKALSPAAVQRLATVLDALEYNVPIGIWDAAQSVPQDTSGHLPATGQLSALQAAAKARDVGKTVLLTLAAFGPDTPDAANLLTLGDTIRALRAAGLDSDARRLGAEALYVMWPRRGG